MEHPYYKIDEVSEMLQISNSDIIRCAASGRLNIYILTAKFKVFLIHMKLNIIYAQNYLAIAKIFRIIATMLGRKSLNMRKACPVMMLWRIKVNIYSYQKKMLIKLRSW